MEPTEEVILMEPTEERRFPCNNCGSDLRFNPDARQLVCDHCGNTEAIQYHPGSADRLVELSFYEATQKEIDNADMAVAHVRACPNCGAQTEIDYNHPSNDCPFCGTPYVTDTGDHRQIKPKGVLPFALSEREAHKAMNDWLGRLWFAPNGLAEFARKGRKMDGIYVPFWTYDAQTRSQYSGERGDHYYETHYVMRDGRRQAQRVRKTRWRIATGRVARAFDDILILASRSLPKRYTDALAPWDLSYMEPFNPEYLAGFGAQAYQVTLEEGFEEARAYMDQMILRDVRFDIGGDVQRVHQIRTQVSNVTFKHILLPVWMAAYQYRGKTYRFVVNGRSGLVKGERPYSAWKIAIAVIFAILIIGGIFYAYGVYDTSGGY